MCMSTFLLSPPVNWGSSWSWCCTSFISIVAPSLNPDKHLEHDDGHDESLMVMMVVIMNHYDHHHYHHDYLWWSCSWFSSCSPPSILVLMIIMILSLNPNDNDHDHDNHNCGTSTLDLMAKKLNLVGLPTEGRPPLKKNVFFRALPKFPLPPPPPPLPFFRATCTSFSAVIKEYIKCIF